MWNAERARGMSLCISIDNQDRQASQREAGREALDAWRAASDRRLRSGQRHIEMGMLGHAPLFTSVEGRRLPDDPAAGVAGDTHEVEAAILLDPNARLGEDGFYHLPEGK